MQHDTANRPTKKWVISFVATLFAMIALQMSHLGFSPLLPEIQKQFSMNYSQVGFFTGIYGLSAILLSIPGGMLAKRFGEKRILAGGLLITALGLCLLGMAPSFGAAIAGRVVWLIGYRPAFICVMTAVALTCPPSLKSSSMGIVGAVASFASVIGAPFGGGIGTAFGWRYGIFAFCGAALLGALVFVIFYRSNPSVDPAVGGHQVAGIGAGSKRPKPASAFRTPIVWSLAALIGMCAMAQLSTTFFVPAAVNKAFNLDSMAAAYIISNGYALAIFTNLLFGYLMDRFDKLRVMAMLMAILIPASFALTTENLLVFRIATALVLAIGFSATNQVWAISGEVLKARETGPVMGVVGVGIGLAGYVGPQMLGVLRDWTGGFNAGWYTLAAIAALGLIEIFFLKQYTKGKMAVARSAVAEVSSDMR